MKCSELQCTSSNYYQTNKTHTNENIKLLSHKVRQNLDDVLVKDQESVSRIVDEKLDKFAICLPDYGKILNLEHLDNQTSTKLTEIINKYQESFSRNKLDIGSFTAFTADINIPEESSAYENPRTSKRGNEKLIANTMEGLISANIFEPASHGMDKFAANLNIVDKPSDDLIAFSRADKYLNKLAGKTGNAGRATVDYRRQNALIKESPPVVLPSLQNVKDKIRGKIISKFDFTQFFFSIRLNQKSKKFTNFWYAGKLYCSNVLPQGLKCSPYIAACAGNATFSEQNLTEFLKMKNLERNTENFPFDKVENMLLYYSDDILLFTPDNVKNPVGLHLLAVEFLLYCVKKMGLKLSMAKSQFLAPKFDFLGLHFDLNQNTSEIPETRRIAFENMRNPRSLGELSSRISSLAYFSKFIPGFRVLCLPLMEAVKKEKFEWGEAEQKSFSNLKHLCSLQIRNNLVDPTKPLFLCSDSSQVAAAYALIQFGTDGMTKLITCDSKLFKAPDRNMSAAHRETVALIWGLTQCETTIRGHGNKVTLLSDCVSVQMLHRSKLNNTKFLEYSMYLSTFTNLGVFYTKGPSLFVADILTRNYDKVFLKNDNNLSKEFASIIPGLNKKLQQSYISPEMLVDYIIATPAPEKLDCFEKGDIYIQNQRYFPLRQFNEDTYIAPELLFLTALYTGHNEKNLTQERLNFINQQILKFPASALTKKLKQPALNELRKQLHTLDMHNIFLSALAKRYGLKCPINLDNGSASQNPLSQKINNVCHTPNMEILGDSRPLGDNSISNPNISCTKNKLNQINGKQKYFNINCLDSRQSNCNMCFNSIKHDCINVKTSFLKDGNEPQKMIDMAELDQISEEELCKIFNINKEDLEDKLRFLLKPILHFFEAIDKNFDITNQTLKNKSELQQLITITILIFEKLKGNQLNILGQNFITSKYNIKSKDLDVKIKQNRFEFQLKNDLFLEPCQAIQLNIDMLIILDQLLNFEENTNLDVSSWCQIGHPPFYNINNITISNFRENQIKLSAGTLIGYLEIVGLKDCHLTSTPTDLDYLQISQTNHRNLENEIKCKMLFDTILSMLKSVPVKNEKKLSKEGKEKLISSLMLKTSAKPSELRHDSKGDPKMDFSKNFENLNKILLSQFLQKTSGILDTVSMIKLQNSDPFTFKLMEKCRKYPDELIKNHFLLVRGVLWHRSKVLGTNLDKLVLPKFLAECLLQRIHHHLEFHISHYQLNSIFIRNFYAENSAILSKKITETCTICILNKGNYLKKTKARKTLNENSTKLGAIWYADIAYMLGSKGEYKFAVIFCERVSNFITIFPARTINVKSLINILRTFTSIFNCVLEVGTDHGAEFSRQFTQACQFYNIKHGGWISNRSQSQGACENSVKQTKVLLGKLIALSKNSKYEWQRLIPKICSTINATGPYNLPISRQHILFSPYISTNFGNLLSNPFLAQKTAFTLLNKKRIESLNNQNISNIINEFKIGQFVVIREDKPTVEGSKQFNPPLHKEIYKITGITKDGFSLTLQCTRTGAKRTVTHNKARGLNIEDYVTFDMQPENMFSTIYPNLHSRGLFKHGTTKQDLQFYPPANDLVRESPDLIDYPPDEIMDTIIDYRQNETIGDSQDPRVEGTDEIDEVGVDILNMCGDELYSNISIDENIKPQHKEDRNNHILSDSQNGHYANRYNLRSKGKIASFLSSIKNLMGNSSSTEPNTDENKKKTERGKRERKEEEEKRKTNRHKSKSILKNKLGYKFTLNMLFSNDQSQNQSLKKGIKMFYEVYNSPNNFMNEILITDFKQSSVLRYQLPIDKLNKSNKKVCFAKFNELRSNQSTKKVPMHFENENYSPLLVNLITIQLSTFHCTSLKETSLLKNL